MSRSFGITFDYLCPFARNANEHVIAGLRAGADWDVSFVPYSLAQGHVPDGAPAIWEHDDPNAASGILALQVGLAVRDLFPNKFLDAHERLFALRHDDGRNIKDEAELRVALKEVDIDPDAVFAEIASGSYLTRLRTEHEAGVRDHTVWGVPTFIGADRAVFVRIMDRPDGDGQLAQRRIDHVLDLVDGAPQLHEFKQTDLEI